MDRTFYVYIVASPSRTLYIGITSNIETRIYQHKNKEYKGFSATYSCDRLVFFEHYTGPHSAIAREKQLKGWTRVKKINLIERNNPSWIDLSEDWGKPIPSPQNTNSS
jgi:putative endonuclease